MNTSYIFICIFFIYFGTVYTAPQYSVFQRNGLQREQEGALHREPFEPLSPFQAHTNVPASGNIVVVPPSIIVDTTLTKPVPIDNYQGVNRNVNFLNHFEILNKDALVGLLIERDIPFYVKTIVEPQKPVQTKIHVMKIPKKHEKTTPLPDIDLNLVEIVNNENATKQHNEDAYEAIDNVKQVQHLVEESRKISNSDVMVKVTDRRSDDVSIEQETPLLTVTDAVQSKTNEDDTLLQSDDPNVANPVVISEIPSTTKVYEHAIIYTPEKSPDTKSIWEHIGSAYDKAKTKTSEFVEKAKDKTDKFIEKAKEKAKDVLDSKSNESKEHVRPEDDI